MFMKRSLEKCLLKCILTNLVQAEGPHILDDEHRYTVGLQRLNQGREEQTEPVGVAGDVKQRYGEWYPHNCHTRWTNNEKSVLFTFLYFGRVSVCVHSFTVAGT